MAQESLSGKRAAGVLLPVTALPSRHGVGDMGPDAYRFIDMLAKSGASYWQILPFGPLGFGNSPYQPYSSFAGDPLLISLDMVAAEGLLEKPPAPFQPGAKSIHYPAVRAYKGVVLRKAFEAFQPNDAYDAFAAQEWVHAYAVFLAFKKANGYRCWNEWPEAQKNWPLKQSVNLEPFDEDIRYEMFLQYLFHTQWSALKRYANGLGVRIIGDIPIYVGVDSQDVWAGRANFLLNADGSPSFVAGVPPDYFSATGQRWGNPVYDWDHLQQTGFAFWINRLKHCAALYDVIRIDHFRGFDTYWKIPASCPTAQEGEWVEAPGYAFFDAVFAALPDIKIIAEDLGLLRDEVYTLRDHYGFPGMKVLQFTFEPGKKIDARNGAARMIAYTGTHDNQTSEGWYRSLPLIKRLAAQKSLFFAGYRRGTFARKFIRLALDDTAELAIIPAQDLMGLADEARINTPGTVGSPNWEWKLDDLSGIEEGLRFFEESLLKSGRSRA